MTRHRGLLWLALGVLDGCGGKAAGVTDGGAPDRPAGGGGQASGAGGSSASGGAGGDNGRAVDAAAAGTGGTDAAAKDAGAGGGARGGAGELSGSGGAGAAQGTDAGATGGTGAGGIAGGGCVTRLPATWQLTSTATQPPPEDTSFSPEFVLWSGAAFFVLRYGAPGGSYDPCLDAWQSVPAYPRVNTLIAQDTGGAYFVLRPPVGQTPAAFSFFDFTTSSWMSLATMGYQTSADWDGAAVVVGGQLIRWGGVVENAVPYSILTNGGAIYDRGRDQWRPMSTAGAPAPRIVSGNVVAAGNRLVVWGGSRTKGANGSNDPPDATLTGSPGLVCPDQDPFNCAYGDGAFYDPAADRWTAIAAAGAPSSRSGHVTAWTGSRLLVWGGTRYDVKAGATSLSQLTDGALYDPGTSIWKPIAPAPPLPVSFYPAAGFAGGRLHLRNGYKDSDLGYDYDPVQDRWVMAVAPDPLAPPQMNAPMYSTVVWTGAYWFRWGGYRNGPIPVNTCGVSFPVCDPPPPPRIFVNEAAIAIPAP